MTADYSSQILATVAAAEISADGSTPITYGCSITRFATGVYKLILPTGEGLIDEQSFTHVTGKGPAQAVFVVSDESIYVKTVSSFADTAGTAVDDAIEVVVQRATINPF
jgi:hypothetical protein